MKMSHQCSQCSKYFSSRQSRWRHEQNCQIKPIVETPFTSTQRVQRIGENLLMKPYKDTEIKPKNLKIQALVYEIVNDDIPTKNKESLHVYEPVLKKKKVAT